MSLKITLSMLIIGGFISSCFAQEQITITTYYPSPFGSYRELAVSERVAIGDISGDGITDAGDMVVDGGGNPVTGSLMVSKKVGIGTRTPIGMLEAVSSNPASDIDNDIVMTSYTSNPFTPGFVTQRARGTKAAPQAVAANDFLGGFVFRGYDGTGFRTVGGMDMRAENNFAAATRTSALNFKTTDGVAYSTKMTILGNGNVGIGTTAPSAPLHIASSGVQPELLLQENDVGHAAQIRFQNVQRTWELGGDAAPDLFYINLAAGPQDIFVIDPTGNVGIGTVAPTTRLEIQGGTTKTTGGLVIETRTTNPANPDNGRMWLCTDAAPYCQ